MNRSLTEAEREQRRADMVQAWADGKFDNRRQGMHPRHWTPAQNQAFTTLAGAMPIEDIADALERRFYIRRSIPSLRIQAKRLSISLWQGGLSMREMERVFGIDHKHITRFWVDAGHLNARRCTQRGANVGWWFTEAELTRFIHECGWLFDVERMKRGHRLTRIAETARKADPWIVGRDALAAVLGCSPNNARQWVDRGLVPHRWRVTAGRGEMICVRGRDIPAALDAIRAVQAEYRLARIARLPHMRDRQSIAMQAAS